MIAIRIGCTGNRTTRERAVGNALRLLGPGRGNSTMLAEIVLLDDLLFLLDSR